MKYIQPVPAVLFLGVALLFAVLLTPAHAQESPPQTNQEALQEADTETIPEQTEADETLPAGMDQPEFPPETAETDEALPPEMQQGEMLPETTTGTAEQAETLPLNPATEEQQAEALPGEPAFPEAEAKTEIAPEGEKQADVAPEAPVAEEKQEAVLPEKPILPEKPALAEEPAEAPVKQEAAEPLQPDKFQAEELQAEKPAAPELRRPEGTPAAGGLESARKLFVLPEVDSDADYEVQIVEESIPEVEPMTLKDPYDLPTAQPPPTPYIHTKDAVLVPPNAPTRIRIAINSKPELSAQAEKIAVLLGNYKRRTLEKQIGLKLEMVSISSAKHIPIIQNVIYYRPRFMRSAMLIAESIPGEQQIKVMSPEKIIETEIDVEIWVSKETG